MNAHAIQHFSQLLNPLFALALLSYAVWQLRKSAWIWITCVALAVGLAQQTSKIVQSARVVNDNFPSTHFAVALALGGAFCALNRRSVLPVAVFLVLYGALILGERYHAPLDLLGAGYAFPLGFGAGRLPLRRRAVASSKL